MKQREKVRSNKFLGLSVVILVVSMVGLAYASVPLYRIFCQVTGYGGTPQIASDASGSILKDKLVTVRFNADVNSSLKWSFKPNQKKVKIPLGESYLASYHATNFSDEVITGTAVFNVTPLKAAQYFTKQECFCFTEQTLLPGEEVDMPVTFYVDPEILNDPNVQEVNTITLSYTFYKAKTDG